MKSCDTENVGALLYVILKFRVKSEMFPNEDRVEG